MALRNCPKITFNNAHKLPNGLWQPIDQTTANTRQSTNFSQQDEQPANHIIKTRRNIFDRQPSLPTGEPFIGLDQMVTKIATSEQGAEDMKKSQRFFESNKRLKTYDSEEKITNRRQPRRCKIFQKRQMESRVSEVTVLKENGSRNSMPRLRELKNSIYVQKQTIQKQTEVRNHVFSQNFLHKQPIRTASPNRITFSYLSQPSSFNTHQQSHSQIPLSHFPMSHNTKNTMIKEHNDVAVRPFISIFNHQEHSAHHNPATTKIKKSDNSIKMSYIPQESGQMSWGNRIKTSLIEANKPRQEILSKISLNICRESMVRAKENEQLDDSDLLIDGNQRYFDNDEAFPTKNKLSYRNIEIGKQEQEHREEEIAPHNYLFIDFENSRRNDKEESQIQTKMESPTHSATPTAIMQQSIMVIEDKNTKSGIKQAYFPAGLIILAALLLFIQIWG